MIRPDLKDQTSAKLVLRGISALWDRSQVYVMMGITAILEQQLSKMLLNFVLLDSIAIRLPLFFLYDVLTIISD